MLHSMRPTQQPACSVLVVGMLNALVQTVPAILVAHDITIKYLGQEQQTARESEDMYVPPELRFEHFLHRICFVSYNATVVAAASMTVAAATAAAVAWDRTARWRLVALVLHAVMQIVLLGSWVTEAVMNLTMGIHFLDPGLLMHIGWGRTIQRQIRLQREGGFLDLKNASMVLGVLGAAAALQAVLILLARVLTVSWGRTLRVMQLFAVGLLPAMAMSVGHPLLLTNRVPSFVSSLPFYGLGLSGESFRLQPSLSRMASCPELQAFGGPGYPLLPPPGSSLAAACPRLERPRNIVLIVQEQARWDQFTPEQAPLTRRFVEEHNCLEVTRFRANAHVTELSLFSLVYGVHAANALLFSQYHVPSLPLQTLRNNGYDLQMWSASAFWMYPNTFLADQFNGSARWFDSTADMMAPLAAYVQAKAQDHQPYFLILHVHYPNRTIAHMLDNIDPRMAVAKDKARLDILQVLAGQMNNTLVAMTSDHGNMDCMPHTRADGSQGFLCEHGELGHSQPESSWWEEKLRVPFFLCAPAEVKLPSTPVPLGSMLDVMPTLLDLLQPEPRLPPATYGHGRSLLGADPVSPLYFANPRFFPAANKILLAEVATAKLWFRLAPNMPPFMEKYTDVQDRPLCYDTDLLPHAIVPAARQQDCKAAQVLLLTAAKEFLSERWLYKFLKNR